MSNKPGMYYICLESNEQREKAQDIFYNIRHKTRDNNGKILIDALSFYNEHLNSKRGKL
jgi:hypothetical protein